MTSSFLTTPLQEPKTEQAVLTDGDLVSHLTMPAVVYQNKQLLTKNQPFSNLIDHQQLLQERQEKIDQVLEEVSILMDTISFDLSYDLRAYHCLAIPVKNQPGTVIILFEDISNEVQTEKNNSLLYRLTLLLSSTDRPLNELLQMAVDQILFELPIFDCSVFLFDKKSGLIQPAAWGTTDLSSQINGKTNFQLGEGIAGHVGLTKRPIVIPDIQEDKRFLRKPSDTGRLTLLCVPLLIGQNFLGTLSITRKVGLRFSDGEVQLFTTIANRLALAVASEQTRQREDRETEFIEYINTTTDLTDHYTDIIARFAELLEVDKCVLYRTNGQSTAYTAGDLSFSDPSLQALQDHLPKKTDKAWLTIDPKKIDPAEPVRTRGSQIILFPLTVHGKKVGCLVVQNTTWERDFTESELAFGASLATQIATTINTAEFHEEVREERNRMQQVLDSLRDGVVLYTPDWKVALYNQKTKQLLGIKKDFIGMPWEEALNQGAIKYSKHRLIRHFDAHAFFEKALHQGKTSTGLATLTTTPPRTMEIATGPVYDRNKKISGVLSHARDITQILELQSKMALRVEQLTNLFKISSVTGYNAQEIVRRILKLTLPLLSVESCQLLLNDQHHHILGTIESAGNQDLLKRLGPKLKTVVAKVNKRQEVESIRISGKSSDAAPIHALAVPVIGHYHSCSGVLVIATDREHRYFSREDSNLLAIVAARIASKLDNAWLLNQVEDDRNKLAAIIDQSVDGILVTNAKQIIEIWNPALENLTGLNSSDILNHTVDEARSMIEILERYQHDTITELKIVNRKTNQPLWLGIAYAPIISNRETTGYVAIVRDISRQKELEKSKNEFISTASHELRSPITAIVGYLSMLKRGDAGQVINKQQAFFVDKAYQNAKRMVMLIEDLLTTTRMETGQARYQIEPIDILDVIEGIISDLRFKAEEKEITIVVDRKSHHQALADRDGIHQVLTNLINNAIKYTPNRGKVEIGFQSKRIDGQPRLLICIRDTGVGIADHDRERIFDKFTRIDNPLSVSAGGTGLGLYITKSILDQLNGMIWLESQKDKGTTFYVSLPAANQTKERSR